jgi:DNA (cytosine-5)-methyltransferase 1
MRYLDVCAGISASTVAWAPLGWRAAAYSEIEAAPRAILSHHYPDTPLHGDFTTIAGDEYGPIDLLVGGTPCQDFSVAGLRAGLDGERGNLSLQFLRLADRARPRWLVWENVPGVLSIDGGRAFGAILGGLGQLGYGFAYRVLDAQHFGVPQRRRRVFVVGCLGDWRRAGAVLFERHSLSGHPAPRREAREGVAVGARPGFAFDGQNIGVGSLDGPAGTLDTGAGHLNRGMHVAHVLRGEGFDASEDGTGRGTPLVPVPFDTTQITSAANYSNPRPGDPCHPLAAGMHPPAIAFTSKDHGQDAGEIAPTLRAMQGEHANAGGQVAVAFDCLAGGNTGFAVGDVAGALRGEGSGGGHAAIASASAVRRLTPRECERLQGFPDDYTLVPYRRGMMADGPRYKALGNSMAVPVMRWIGERIAAVDALAPRAEAA